MGENPNKLFYFIFLKASKGVSLYGFEI